jgi:glucokinase
MGARFAIGLDLGGTRLKSGRVAPDGNLDAFAVRPSRAGENERAPLEAIAAAIAELEGDPGACSGVGLGIPGVVDTGRGALVDATPHLPHWRDLAVVECVYARTGTTVALDNDANLAALAEWRIGAARGARDALVVTVGTGVGCGIVAGGRVLRGARGGAGEIGHLPLDGTFPCRCGVRGCVEPEMGGEGLVRAARARGLDAADAEGVFAAGASGDVRAGAAIARMVECLAATITAGVHLLDPEVVVVGGGLAGAADRMLEPLRAAVARRVLPSHARGLRIVPAALGDRAGVVGAGLLAWERASVTAAAR